MKDYILKKVILGIPVILTVSVLVFFLIHLIPGDPVDFMLGENAALEQKEEVRRLYHLDRPVHIQFGYFVSDLLRGRLISFHTRQPVIGILAEKFPNTLVLAAFSMTFALLLAIPLGVLSAYYRYSPIDNFSLLVALVGVSMPNFWLGPLLILIFSINLYIFPVSGAETLSSVVLPGITLGLGLTAILTRMTRASMLDVLKEDYILSARARGLSETRVILNHALRNALIPVITTAGLQFGSLLTGSIITEEIFSWPGIGREVINSIRTRDFPLVQGCVLLIAFTYVIVNILVDILYALVNPRVRHR